MNPWFFSVALVVAIMHMGCSSTRDVSSNNFDPLGAQPPVESISDADTLDPLPPSEFGYDGLLSFAIRYVMDSLTTGYEVPRQVPHPGGGNSGFYQCRNNRLQYMRLLVWDAMLAWDSSSVVYRAYIWVRSIDTSGSMIWYLMSLERVSYAGWEIRESSAHTVAIRDWSVCFAFPPRSSDAYKNLWTWNRGNVSLPDSVGFSAQLPGTVNWDGLKVLSGGVRVNTWKSVFGDGPNVLFETRK